LAFRISLHIVDVAYWPTPHESGESACGVSVVVGSESGQRLIRCCGCVPKWMRPESLGFVCGCVLIMSVKGRRACQGRCLASGWAHTCPHAQERWCPGQREMRLTMTCCGALYARHAVLTKKPPVAGLLCGLTRSRVGGEGAMHRCGQWRLTDTPQNNGCRATPNQFSLGMEGSPGVGIEVNRELLSGRGTRQLCTRNSLLWRPLQTYSQGWRTARKEGILRFSSLLQPIPSRI
jgi:hypothetical protein